MVWTADAPHAGFTTGTPWLPVKPPQAARAVDRQEAEERSVLHHYRRVLSFYRDTPALLAQGTEWLDLPEPLLAFRRGDGDPLTCLFNLCPAPARVSTDGGAALTGPSAATLEDGEVILPGYGYAWLTGAPALSCR